MLKLHYFYSQNLKKIINHGSPWSKYILLNSIDKEFESTKQRLLAHKNIAQIISLLEDQKVGINSLNQQPADFRLYNSFFWTLRFFADLGLTSDDLGINQLIHKLQLQQSENGQFIIRYLKKRGHSISLVCLTAHLTYCLIRLGLRNSPTVKAALKYIVTSQRKDGGWHCNKLRQNGERDENLPYCAAANIHVIRALGQFGDKYESILYPALKQCLAIFENRAGQFCIYDSKNQLNLFKLRYPPHFTGLDILNVIDSLSYYPVIFQNASFERMVFDIINRWDGIHLLNSEKRIHSWSCFDFAHNNKNSDWITAIFVRALRRIYFRK